MDSLSYYISNEKYHNIHNCNNNRINLRFAINILNTHKYPQVSN